MKIQLNLFYRAVVSVILTWLCVGCSQSLVPVVENNLKAEKQVCIAGYVVELGSSVQEGLVDAPREYSYTIQIENGSKVKLAYTAYPPGPARRNPALNFYAGSIQVSDFLEACGQENDSPGTVFVTQPEDYIRSYPSARYVVVRHAEKLSNTTNASLSPKGLMRAQRYASIFSTTNFEAAIATEFCRTAQTAQPLSAAQNLPLFIQGFDFTPNFLEACDPQISIATHKIPAQFNDLPSILAFISDKHSIGSLFIVAHSNSVPDWVSLLSGHVLCPSIIP